MPSKLPERIGTTRATPNVTRQVQSIDMGATARQASRDAQQTVNAGNALGVVINERDHELDQLNRNRARHIKNDAKRKIDEFTIGTR